jgi:hypothetical protein
MYQLFASVFIVIACCVSFSAFAESKPTPPKEKAGKAARKPDSSGQWHREYVRNIAKANKYRQVEMAECPLTEKERELSETYGTSYYYDKNSNAVLRLVSYYPSQGSDNEADRAMVMNMATCEKSEVKF